MNTNEKIKRKEMKHRDKESMPFVHSFQNNHQHKPEENNAEQKNK